MFSGFTSFVSAFTINKKCCVIAEIKIKLISGSSLSSFTHCNLIWALWNMGKYVYFTRVVCSQLEQTTLNLFIFYEYFNIFNRDVL